MQFYYIRRFIRSGALSLYLDRVLGDLFWYHSSAAAEEPAAAEETRPVLSFEV